MNRISRFLLPATTMLLAACADTADDGHVVGELASDRLELIAEVDEPILEILVAEGQTVSEGQLILRQDDSRARARLAEADAAVGQAQARLDELVRGPRQDQISQARANLDGANRDVTFRETEFERARDLLARDLGSQEFNDRAKANLDTANANLDLRRAQLEELLAGTTVEELAQADQSLKQAEARRDNARIDVDRHLLHAPVDGLLDSRLFEPGERPVAGRPVAILLGGEQPFARIYVPENLRVHISPGLTAEIHVDGLDTPVPGRVRWVASEAAFTPYFALTEHDRGRLTFLAKVDVMADRDRLPDGVPVEVDLHLEDHAR
jgi:HlyD family secretion protein